MSRFNDIIKGAAYNVWIHTTQEPDQVCRGNAKRYDDVKPAGMYDSRPLKQILDEQEASDIRQDEWLKSKGII